MMNKEIKISLVDLYLGYACTALAMYAIGGVAYSFGKNKARIEITERIQEIMREAGLHPETQLPRK